jgi:hypothetical protein
MKPRCNEVIAGDQKLFTGGAPTNIAYKNSGAKKHGFAGKAFAHEPA